MNKKGKIMVALLSVATMTAGVLGIAGCKDKKGGESAKDVYSAYAQFVEAKGETPMSYENWLATVKSDVYIKGNAGAPGAPGTDGTDGADGADGADGVSITEVKLSTDGKKLDIYYSNNTVGHVDLPENLTHVHTYDDNSVVTLLAPTETVDGLGYKVCTGTGCDHVEHVVLPHGNN